MFNTELTQFDSNYYSDCFYANYKTVFKTICSHINCLVEARENRESTVTINFYANKLKEYSYVFDGYIDCLFDLRVISEKDYNSFYEFAKAIRIECNYIIW